MDNEVNMKVEMHGICGRPMKALPVKSQVHKRINDTLCSISSICLNIIDRTIHEFLTKLNTDQIWYPVCDDTKTSHYVVADVPVSDISYIDRLHLALHENLVCIDVILSVRGESRIAIDGLAAVYVEDQMRRSFLLRINEFDIPVTLTVNKYDSSELFEFHYDPDNENTEE